AFLRRSATQSSLRLQPFIRSSADTFDPLGHPHLDRVSVTGPFNPTGPGDTPSRREVFICRPATSSDEQPCAQKVLSRLMRGAYRGQGTKKDLERLMTFYTKGRNEDSFENGIQMALERMLVSSKFVFRMEYDPAKSTPGAVYPVSDLDLASRL